MIEEFDEMKQDILLASLDRNKILRLNLEQAFLPIRLGGLGLTKSLNTAHAAFVASTITSYDSIKFHFPEIDVETDLFYDSFKTSLDFIKQHVDLKIQDNFTTNNIFNLYMPTTYHLQSEISNNIMDEAFIKFKENVIQNNNNNIYLSWLTSLESSSSAGSFLLATPKHGDFTFSNAEFCTALSVRLHLSIPTLSPEQACNCKKKPTIDSTGHHLITGCNEGGIRQSHHMAVEHIIIKLLQYSGLLVKSEEQGCFQGLDPFDNKRPDISIFNTHILGLDKKMILDISITSPLIGSANGILQPISIKEAKKPLNAATIRFNQKNAKYKNVSIANNLIFMPIIFETSGALHPDAEKFIKKIAKIGSQLHFIDYDIYYNYCMKCISCVFQKSISNNINMRIAKLLLPLGNASAIISNISDYNGINMLIDPGCFNTSQLINNL
jgi:hypothetical protein